MAQSKAGEENGAEVTKAILRQSYDKCQRYDRCFQFAMKRELVKVGKVAGADCATLLVTVPS